MQKHQQPRDFNKVTSTRSDEQKQVTKQAKHGMYTGLVPEPGMPGFNHFSGQKRSKAQKKRNQKAQS